MKIDKIILRGEKEPVVELTDTPSDMLELRASYIPGGRLRSNAEKHTIDLRENDIIELVFEDNTTWYCSPDTLDEVFPSAAVQSRSADDAFELPLAVTTATVERGIVGDAFLKLFRVFSKKAVGKEIRELAEDLEKKQLENLSGLFHLNDDFRLDSFKNKDTSKTFLVFIHGTASSTRGSFFGIFNTPLWTYIRKTFGNNILAFQHESLTKSPLQNALELAEALPDNSVINLVTHSRGGIVADILNRYCVNDQHNRGFSELEIAYLKKTKRTDDLRVIGELDKVFLTKKLTVNNFVRVACPAGGTILASNRIDNFFNVIINLIGVGTGMMANPVFLAFKSLLAAAINSKNDVDVLPGLEAMNPDSAFIKVLNSPATSVLVDTPLSVISGSCKTKLNLKALLIIVSKLFYLNDNDLVVNTRSMYQGSRRTAPIRYFFDEGTDVDHFSYFSNKRTNEAILNAFQIAHTEKIPGFNVDLQESIEAAERNAILRLDGGQVYTDTVTGTRPIVLLLPGIMGSNLSSEGDLIWINYLRFAAGDLARISITKGDIKAKSIVRTSYYKLVMNLGTEYDVVTFPYDWRMQLNKVAESLKEKILELMTYRQPIKVIGHSMGGVLMRDFMITQRETWELLNRSPNFKLIFLGSPLGGSFRIPYVLFGKDAIIDKISRLDIFHTKKELLSIFSRFPGLLSLLPLTEDAENDFSDLTIWEKMGRGIGIPEWPTPTAADLKVFREYRTAINKGLEPNDYSNAVYIAGRDLATPYGYRLDTTEKGEELTFLSTAEGDQSVTWETGIPKKMIQDKTVYYVNVSHGSLANEPSMFNAIKDILQHGHTNMLSRNRPAIRAEQKVFKTPELNDYDLSPRGVENTILGIKDASPQTDRISPLTVTVANGDLRYASYPIIAGHFLNDGILYAEKAINSNLRGALSERHALGLYPGEIGSSEVLLTPNEKFPGAIIVGLGVQGTLTAYQLTQSITQGAAKYVLDANRGKGNIIHEKLGISSLIIGCGYGGLSVDSSIRAVIQGIQNANEKIRKAGHPDFKFIETIEFVEQYEDRALSCFYSVTRIENEESKTLNISSGNQKILQLLGSKKRLPADTIEEWWNRINVSLVQHIDLTPPAAPGTNIPQPPAPPMRTLSFSASTGGAREESRDLHSSSPVLEELISEISSDNRWSPALAKTIFELLIPNDFKDQLKRQCKINWILDKHAAAYPWELLQDSATDAKPLCINAGMIRQLKTQDYRLKINAVSKDTALVIGDPELKGFLQQLPGAKEEGETVSKMLEGNGFTTTSIISGTAPSIIESLFKDDYKIIHLAGHGIFNEKSPANSGMVIGKNVFLSTLEISQMSSVPELVVVNCCYLGKTDGVAEAYFRNRYKMAANIGTQLIENGVKAVIVAGWAVEDSAALEFTKTFYHNMFEGIAFGDAVHMARKHVYSIYKNQNNTWGAYQCYGDPFYKFTRTTRKTGKYTYKFDIDDQAEIELYNLRNTIETGNYTHDHLLEQLDSIAEAIESSNLRTAAITEQEALIYADLYEYQRAISKFETLLKMENASFDVATLERYCNIRAKNYVLDYLKTKANPKNYLPLMNSLIKELEVLFTVSPTAERYMLMGSTLKRKVVFMTGAEKKMEIIKEAAYNYMKAYTINNSFNALINWYQLETVLVLTDHRQWSQEVTIKGDTYKLPSSAKVAEKLQEGLDQAGTKALDYYNMGKNTNIKLCMLIGSSIDGDPGSCDAILTDYKQIWNHAGSRGKKFSEIEHIDLLIDALSVSRKRNVTKLRKMLEGLKEDMLRLI